MYVNSWMCSRVSFWGCSPGLSIFQAAQIVWECSHQSLRSYILEREESIESYQFQGLPETIELLAFCAWLASLQDEVFHFPLNILLLCLPLPYSLDFSFYLFFSSMLHPSILREAAFPPSSNPPRPPSPRYQIHLLILFTSEKIRPPRGISLNTVQKRCNSTRPKPSYQWWTMTMQPGRRKRARKSQRHPHSHWSESHTHTKKTESKQSQYICRGPSTDPCSSNCITISPLCLNALYILVSYPL